MVVAATGQVATSQLHGHGLHRPLAPLPFYFVRSCSYYLCASDCKTGDLVDDVLLNGEGDSHRTMPLRAYQDCAGLFVAPVPVREDGQEPWARSRPR